MNADNNGGRRQPEHPMNLGKPSVYTETGWTKMSRYTVFSEPTATGYSAHVPDLPGCVAAASTLDDMRKLIKEAIEFHIEGLGINGDMVPRPTPHVEQIEVSA
jgi:predicted RNase H-like HicB family nuclease